MDIVQEILWRTFIEIADMDRDMHENTDLVLKTPFGDVEISVRIRTHGQFKSAYKYEFTLCCHRNSGADAEWQKIFGHTQDGTEHGKYIFYGFEDETGTDVIWWFIGDLDAFRIWWRQGKIKFKPTSNNDPYLGDITRNGLKIGMSKKVPRYDYKTGEKYYDYFYVFDRRNIPGFVVATSEDLA